MTDEQTITESEEDTGTDASAGAVMARLGPAAWLAVAWTVMPAVLGLTVFVRYRGEVADWLGTQGNTGIAIYIGAFAATAGLGLLPTWVQALIGGYAFGMATGSPAAIAGFTLAAVIGFGVAKLVARDKVEDEIDRHSKAKAVREALIGRSPLKTLGLVMLIRVPPNSPFAITNLVLTSVKTPLWVYTLGTAAGMAPRTVLSVWFGSQISDWDDLNKPKWLIYGGIVVMLFVMGVIGHIANKAIEKVTGNNEDAEAGPEDSESATD